MNSLKFLSIIVFALCLIGTVSAVAVYGDWEDSSQSITIIEGENVDFNVDLISINSPMTMNIVLYDSQSNILYNFEDGLIVSDTSYFSTYTLGAAIYSVPGNYELVISGSDQASVPAQAYDEVTLYLTVNAIPDTNEPVITLLGSNPVTIVQGNNYIDAGATAFDQEDGDLTANIVVSGIVNTNVVGNYVLRYNVQDNAGNNANEVTRTVNVIANTADTTAPVITLVGNAIENIALGTTYTDAGATAIDNVDGDITANIVVSNPVDTNTIGIYTITYNVQDNAGNNANEVTRTVNVYNPGDTTLPVITVISPKDGREYSESELTFEIKVNEIVEVEFRLDNNPKVTMDFVGISNNILTFTYNVNLEDRDYKVKFYATDAAGNIASKTVEFSINTEGKKDKKESSITEETDNYQDELYLDQFKPKNVIYLEDEEPKKTELNWWQKFVAWLKRIFGFD